VISRALEGYQRANFQVAIDAYLKEEGRQAELIGLPMMRGYRVGLAELVDDRMRGPWRSPEGDAGPIEYEPVEIGERQIMCVAAGLWLITAGAEGMLLMLRREDHGPGHAQLGIEIMAQARASAERLLGELDRLMTELNVYRGRILALSGSPFGGLGVEVRRLPPVRREQIVFPDGVLERIERHTKTFAQHSEALRASGRHLKRGLLLHGPPGTGKTLTAMYLSHLMPDRTVLLLTGEALHAVGPACRMARELAPSMVVLEDVDLVAEDREYGHSTSELFELLNEMDGLSEDTDVVFVLTTNRAEAIESALASRPGRVDLAVAMPPTGVGGCSISMVRGCSPVPDFCLLSLEWAFTINNGSEACAAFGPGVCATVEVTGAAPQPGRRRPSRFSPACKEREPDHMPRPLTPARSRIQAARAGGSAAAVAAIAKAPPSETIARATVAIVIPWSGRQRISTSSPAPSSPSWTMRRYAPGRPAWAKRRTIPGSPNAIPSL